MPVVIEGLGWFIAGVACLVATLFFIGLHVLWVREWRRERRQLDERRRKYDQAEERRHAEFMRAQTWYQRASLGWSNKRGKA